MPNILAISSRYLKFGVIEFNLYYVQKILVCFICRTTIELFPPQAKKTLLQFENYFCVEVINVMFTNVFKRNISRLLNEVVQLQYDIYCVVYQCRNTHIVRLCLTRCGV